MSKIHLRLAVLACFLAATGPAAEAQDADVVGKLTEHGGLNRRQARSLVKEVSKKMQNAADSFAGMNDPVRRAMRIAVFGARSTGPQQDMVNDAKKNNKTLSFASQVSAATLMTMAITKKTGVKFNVVNVKGGALGIQQVLGGHVDVTWSGSGWNQQVDAGTMKALASMGSKRNADYPNLPTLKELGYDFEFTDTFMLSAPKGLPKPILDRLSAAVKKATSSPEFEKTLHSKMKLIVDYRDPAETVAYLHKQHDVVAPLVQELKKK